jgi:hypothetical protein
VAKIGAIRNGIVVEHARQRSAAQYGGNVRFHLPPVAAIDVGRKDHQPGTPGIGGSLRDVDSLVRGERGDGGNYRRTAAYGSYRMLEERDFLVECQSRCLAERTEHNQAGATVIEQPAGMFADEAVVSAVTYAAPVMLGTTRSPQTRMVPPKILSRIPS